MGNLYGGGNSFCYKVVIFLWNLEMKLGISVIEDEFNSSFIVLFKFNLF